MVLAPETEPRSATGAIARFAEEVPGVPTIQSRSGQAFGLDTAKNCAQNAQQSSNLREKNCARREERSLLADGP